MIKTILIEDEINAREALTKMLKIIEPKIQIIAETGFVSEAVNLIKDQKPDLVFLDIQLEDGTGFDLLKQLDSIDFKIIFTTAYNQYAINAFKFSAVDYLLKPTDPIDLKEAINRALSLIYSEKEHQNLVEILKNNETSKNKKIVLKTTQQRYVLNINDIIHLKADGAYTIFKTAQQKIIVSKNLRYYQDLLNTHFVRCHQSHLINLKQVKGINKKGFLIMSNQDEIPVSSRKKSEIKKLITHL